MDSEYFDEYIENHHPGKVIEDFTSEEIGYWPLIEIFPSLTTVIPDTLMEILSNDFESFSYLPYHHLHYYKYEGLMLWSCHHCGWWHDLFDQRVMEDHLIKRCSKVRLYISFFDFFSIRFQKI